jgi:chemotaxis-related protein WspD
MMQSRTNDKTVEPIALDACWNRIGVQGDQSCPKLAEAIHCRNCAVFADAGQRLFQREAPPEYLEERTRQLAEVEEPAAADLQSLLVFRVGPEWLAIDARAVIEVVEPRTVHRVPHRTDRLLLGLVNIRGELHLCISLRELLGIEPAEQVARDCPDFRIGENGTVPFSATKPKQRLLVVALGADPWVFPVDEVEGVHRISAAAMEDLPHTVQKSSKYYSQAIFSHKDDRIGVLSESRLSQALEKIVR